MVIKPKFHKTALIGLFALFYVSGLLWANYQFALASPGGTDFLVHWVGARTLLHGESPYGDKTALEIQNMVYGRPALTGEHELRVAYPIYSSLIFGPFALASNFILARSLWMTFLEVVILGVSWLALKVVDWRPRPLILSAFMIFSLLWYHSVRVLINANAVAVVALLFVGVAWAIRNRRDGLAGTLLALATIKPHLALLPGLLALLWMISNRRWKFVLGFSISLLGLILAGMALVPGWLMQNITEIMRYTSYNPPTTVGAVFKSWFPDSGDSIGWVISVVLAGVLLWEWKRALHSNFERFLWVFALTLVVSQWIGITTDPGNFIILILPLALVFKFINQLPRGEMWLGIMLVVLFIGLWTLFLVTLPPGSDQQSPIMFFPLPFLLLVGLYFCRAKYIGETV